MKVAIVFGHGSIFSPKSGGESRVFHLVKELSKNNEIITIESYKYSRYSFENFSVKRYFFNSFNYRNINFGTYFADLNLDYILKIYQIVKRERPEILQITGAYGLISAKLLTKLKQKTIVVYDAHNVELDRLKEMVMNNHSLNLYGLYLVTKILEHSVKIVDHIITVSENDREKFIKLYLLDEHKISVIPSGTVIPDVEYNVLECRKEFKLDDDKTIILFHGTYNYLPNKQAIWYIEKYIAPHITKNHKDVLFVIAGKDVPILNNTKGKIRYLGFVKELYKLIFASDIAIAPILTGGGTRLKILDYMGVGKPIVATKKGIEGIEAKNGRHAMIVSNVDMEFINALKYLIENGDVRRKLGRNAKKLAKEKYDWKKIGEKLNKLYNSLVENEL